MRNAILMLCLLLTVSPVLAADAPSVAVQTVVLKQQLMTATVSGYGVVSPGTRSLQNISLPRAGQVLSLLVNAGQVVKQGTPLFEFGTGSDAALGYQQAVTAVRFAANEVTRIDQLQGQQLATQSQLGAAKKSLADAQAALIAQQKTGSGRGVERIRAPFDGMVASITAAQGDRLAAGAPILQLVRAGDQRVLLGVEPEDVTSVRPGMAVTLVSVFNSAHQVTGKVIQVFGMINPQSQFVDVLVEVAGGEFIPGTRVRADIQLNQQSEWVVPRSAVLRDVHGAYLYQVQAGKAHRVNVFTGLEQNGLVAVNGAVNKSQPVISLGNYELQDGMAVHGSRP